MSLSVVSVVFGRLFVLSCYWITGSNMLDQLRFSFSECEFWGKCDCFVCD